jgi:hypothetical protein
VRHSVPIPLHLLVHLYKEEDKNTRNNKIRTKMNRKWIRISIINSSSSGGRAEFTLL